MYNAKIFSGLNSISHIPIKSVSPTKKLSALNVFLRAPILKRSGEKNSDPFENDELVIANSPFKYTLKLSVKGSNVTAKNCNIPGVTPAALSPICSNSVFCITTVTSSRRISTFKDCSSDGSSPPRQKTV